MSATNSPVFNSEMNNNDTVMNSSTEDSSTLTTKKMTKKQEKDLERAAKKKAKEEAAAAKELAKKEKEDAKKAKADEKAAKALAKEQAKKEKEEAKAAKELAKKEKAEAKLNKANAKKSNASSSQDLPQESSQDLPQESSQDLAQESSLPAKFNKFFEFAYFLIKHFEKSGKFSQEHISSMTQLALLLPSNSGNTTLDYTPQISFIHSFLDSQKLLSADLKRLRKSSSSKPFDSHNSDFVAQLVQHALHDHNDLPILTFPFSFQNQHFLIDNDNNLYHSELHHTLGKWLPDSQQISLY
jgi:flagellar biosynthesis GTPase FlhF